MRSVERSCALMRGTAMARRACDCRNGSAPREISSVFSSVKKNFAFFFVFLMHPLRSKDPTTLLAKLDRLCGDNLVQKRSKGDYTLYKYCDAPKITGDARLARGLLVYQNQLLNLPLPKFDELVSFRKDIVEYHAAMLTSMPTPLFVQPKLDGTCVHALWHRGALVLHTFLSFDNFQVALAQKLLAGRKWKEGLTLAFELVNDDDPKVQQERTFGLFLLYGADGDSGMELTRKELSTLAAQLDLPLVKQQTVRDKRRVLEIVQTLDDASTISKVREGIVLIDTSGRRFKLKSHIYLQLTATKVVPTRRWLHAIVRQSTTMDALHDAVEMVAGPLDTAHIARMMLVDLIESAKTLLADAYAMQPDSLESIAAAPNCARRAIRFAVNKRPTAYDDDDGVLQLLKLVSKFGDK